MRTKVSIPPDLVNNKPYQNMVRDVESYLQGIAIQPAIYAEKEPSAELRLYENGNGTPVLVIEFLESTRSTVRAYYLEEISDPVILRLRIGEMTREFLRWTSREVQHRIREAVSQMAEEE